MENQKRLRGIFSRNAATLAALLTALMGIVNVLSSISPAMADRLHVVGDLMPLYIANGSRLGTALAGFALLILSVNLWRRKRVALYLTLAVLALSVVGHLLKGLDFEEAGIAVLLALGLFRLRRHFYARSDEPSVIQGVLVLCWAIAFTLVYGVLGFYLLDRHFSVNFLFLPAVEQTVLMFVQFSNPGLEPITGFGRYFADSIYAIAVATMSYSLVMLVRPVILRQAASVSEQARAAGIIEAHGRSSLTRFALFDDKSYFFSPGGSVVAYIVKGRGALALGDPIGPLQDSMAAITAFKQLASENDWVPCFYQVLSNYLDDYKRCGFQTITIGQECMVDMKTFSLEGKTGKEFRTVVNRMTRLGFNVEILHPPQTDTLLADLKNISDEWLQMMHGTEMKFSLGWFDEEYVRSSVIAVVKAAGGEITAFANIITNKQANLVTLDLMRRRHQIENGSMDFLFISIFEWARKEGYAWFSLGLSALSGVGQKPDDPAIEQALRYIYENADRIYNFKGLHAFKDKFHPQWEPRYLVYPDTASLPVIAVSLVRAHSGDHFLSAYLRK